MEQLSSRKRQLRIKNALRLISQFLFRFILQQPQLTVLFGQLRTGGSFALSRFHLSNQLHSFLS